MKMSVSLETEILETDNYAGIAELQSALEAVGLTVPTCARQWLNLFLFPYLGNVVVLQVENQRFRIRIGPGGAWSVIVYPEAGAEETVTWIDGRQI
jgi:hypothetical protein